MTAYVLASTDETIQCSFCRMWCNPADVGRREPGVCVFCDELADERAAAGELRGLLNEPCEGQLELWTAYRGLLRDAAALIRAMRADVESASLFSKELTQGP